MDLDPTGSSPGVVPGSRKSVPYGQACTNCSKAKCKCISRGGGGAVCERCQRLGKECIPSVSVRKRAIRRPAAERTAHLEEKLDDLVSILRAQAAGSGSPASVAAFRAAAANGDLPGGPDVNAAAAALELDPNISVVQGIPKIASGSHPLPMCPPPAEAALCERYPTAASYPTPSSVASSQESSVSPAEAEEILRSFRDQYIEFFPFVYIPPETTAAQLQQSRPFLWLNIVAVCCKNQQRKLALGHKIREHLAQRMLIDLDRNIDLLLGLLAYLGWAMHHFNGKPYINACAGLALSVVTDLRLDKAPQENYYKELHCFKPSYPYPKIPFSSTRSNEERRATLACFIIVTSISNFLRTQTMRWTAHMEDSLQKLASRPESPQDEVLVAMVKAYKVQEEVAQITWRTVEPPGNPMSLKAPPAIYVKALRANLEAIKKDLPPSLQDNKVVTSHIYAAELSIADMSLWHVSPWLTTNPAKPATIGSTGCSGIDLGKLDAYYTSLQASKACLENFMSFRPDQVMCFSFFPTLHFGRSAQTLYRLMVVDDPEWDRNIVKNSIDLMAVMERTANQYAQVASACGLEVSDDPEFTDYFTKASNALRATIVAWGATLEQTGLGSGTGTGPSAGVAAGPRAASTTVDQMPQEPVVPEFMSMDWLEDPWLTDMLQSWEGNGN
ncbi:uncharacterized protein F4822DRAFT_393909 [Hypoxylon trugodes]|uniref:uncharacterized protein n=1 Tax=Hypoxylon trugodes TaxID=326681 RepID=UPI00218E42D4|nr:uncharacterized protein F4822DRAFT_393909 [Hypoxylon trugodes]KAI1390648.1 hypothetical protein F4822DRAFT_393909 [Hypoxylon trugodes]